MKRLLYIVVGCTVLGTFLFTSAIFAGRLQPVQSPLPELHRCGQADQLVCYRSIEPGRTSLDEALTVLQNTSDLVVSEDSKIGNYSDYAAYKTSAPTYMLMLIPEYAQTRQRINRVGGFDLAFQDVQLNAAQMIAWLGTPCYVWKNASNLILFYPTVSVVLADSAVSPTSEVKWFNTYLGADNSSKKCGDMRFNPAIVRYNWRGFRDYSELKSVQH